MYHLDDKRTCCVWAHVGPEAFCNVCCAAARQSRFRAGMLLTSFSPSYPNSRERFVSVRNCGNSFILGTMLLTGCIRGTNCVLLCLHSICFDTSVIQINIKVVFVFTEAQIARDVRKVQGCRFFVEIQVKMFVRVLFPKRESLCKGL